MNNVSCSRLGNMLHPDIQKWKEAMKTSEFQKYLGGTSVCMNILVMATKGCGQLASNDTYFADSRFSYVKTAEEPMNAGVDYCGPERRSTRVLCSYIGILPAIS